MLHISGEPSCKEYALEGCGASIDGCHSFETLDQNIICVIRLSNLNNALRIQASWVEWADAYNQ